jgi:predicted Zn-dependent protease
MSAAEDGNTPHRIEAVTFLAPPGLQPALVQEIVARTSAHLDVPCRLHTAPWDQAASRLAGREQCDADALLFGLEKSVPPSSTVHVGLTEHDLGLLLFTFVFGRARRFGHAAIVSLARLAPERYGLPADPSLMARRALAETLHEIGHVVGLAHCQDMNCIMYFATNVETIDLRGMDFCTTCKTALPAGLAGSTIPRTANRSFQS